MEAQRHSHNNSKTIKKNSNLENTSAVLPKDDNEDDNNDLDGSQSSYSNNENDSSEHFKQSPHVHWSKNEQNLEEGAISDQDVPIGNIEKYQELPQQLE